MESRMPVLMALLLNLLCEVGFASPASRNESALRRESDFFFRSQNPRLSNSFSEQSDQVDSGKNSSKVVLLDFVLGKHSNNLSSNLYGFGPGFLFAVDLGIQMPSDNRLIFSFIYWDGKGTHYAGIQRQVVTKRFQVGFDFVVARIGQLALRIGPTVGIESINVLSGTSFSLGARVSFSYPLIGNILYFSGVSSFSGGGTLSVGGGYSYWFGAISVGLSVNLTHLITR